MARAPEIGLTFGLTYYHSHPGLRTLFALHYEVHDEDLAAARLLLAHPDMNAIGPNDRRYAPSVRSRSSTRRRPANLLPIGNWHRVTGVRLPTLRPHRLRYRYRWWRVVA
jgi:hypothetical protein